MKLVKYICISLCLSLSAVCFAQQHKPTLNINDLDSKDYILNHGHSPEIVRMINLQKERTEPDARKVKKNNRFVKFLKNLYYERDLSMPVRDFGNNRISTPESSLRAK